MDPVFKKLNFKEHPKVLVLNAPKSFEENIEGMHGLTQFCRQIEELDKINFLISFVTKKVEIDEQVPLFAPKLKDDSLLWFCYPKGTSKNYTCDFNRDNGWSILGEYGFEGVRMVSIDHDWSALRFRNVKYIKKMTRSFAMTEEGKRKSNARKG